MITDVLYKRYRTPWLRGSGVPDSAHVLLRQAALIFHQDVAPYIPAIDKVYEAAFTRLCRELGAGKLGEGRTFEEQCIRFIGEPYDLWNNSHGLPDEFFKYRLSLTELLFREVENRLRGPGQDGPLERKASMLRKRVRPKSSSADEGALQAFTSAVSELNTRFREAELPFEYHNGLIQLVDDPLTSEQIEHPFWALVAEPKWRNVDGDVKEAIDRRDAGKGDAAFFALRALESMLKIISDDVGATRGTETAASAFVENLVGARGGRFIQPWEAEAMKHLFRNLRNPQGHGAGSAEPLSLTSEQSTFVIETCMAWIKSLARRK